MRDHPYQLPRSIKAHVFAAIEGLGLSPTDFAWSSVNDVGGRAAEQLFHGPTSSYFRIGRSLYPDSHFSASHHPHLANGTSRVYMNTDADVAYAFIAWLQRVKQDHETPDLWAAIAAERELLESEPPDGDGPFTPQEVQLLTERLKLLEGEISRIANPSPDQARSISRTLQVAAAAAERLTRKEWKMLFIGALMQEAVGLGLDYPRVQQIWHLVNIYIGPIVTRVEGLLT